MEIHWSQKDRPASDKKMQNAALKGIFVTLNDWEEYAGAREVPPTQDARAMCRALRADKLPEYLSWLEQKPKKKMLSKFRGIINSRSNGLPVLDDEEAPNIILEDIAFDPIQNVQARMMTKITLLLIVQSESQKTGIWNDLQTEWTENYLRETKRFVRILEAIIKQCENSGQQDRAAALRNSINQIKAANRQYTIQW
ncbi:MAG: hypothetical protein WCC72_11160 [Dehalococcoidales bacterium]|jgi:hypothetical protein